MRLAFTVQGHRTRCLSDKTLLWCDKDWRLYVGAGCLDHLIVLNEKQSRRIQREYFHYYTESGIRVID